MKKIIWTAIMALTLVCAVFAKEEQKVEIVNSYDNTEELMEQFKVINPSAINSKMEKNIQNRLLTGFANWNRGYDAWLAWGNILYTPESIYNVHGAHLTLEEYQKSMSANFKYIQIDMGDFQNMLICDDWCAIRYDIYTKNKATGTSTKGSVIEFVNFKDYGSEFGTRVVEGWGGIKDKSYYGLSNFMTEEERAAQEKANQKILDYKLPETKNLSKKYVVKYPTKNYGKLVKPIKQYILEDFDLKNQNAENEEYLYFDNMLIKDDWAAIHYWYVKTDAETGERTPWDGMCFYHFEKDGKGVKLIEKIGD